MPNCIGCTKETGDAPVHLLVLNADHDQVSWHMDCHALATGCEICAAVVDLHPDMKDAELGQAILANNPNDAVKVD